MIRAFSKALALILAALWLSAAALPARAAIVADPAALYQQMKDAYAKGSANGWDFRSQEVYLSTIFKAGRAYSPQRPDSPAYGELAVLPVQTDQGVHCRPWPHEDAAVWWVREGADGGLRHTGDP